MASSAAFEPPMATVATGYPVGIITVEQRASTPARGPACRGTPITGSVVLAAIAPARWAARPAPAIITPTPRSLAARAYSLASSGVRCADMTLTSNGTPNLSRISMAGSIFAASEPLPITTATFSISAQPP